MSYCILLVCKTCVPHLYTQLDSLLKWKSSRSHQGPILEGYLVQTIWILAKQLYTCPDLQVPLRPTANSHSFGHGDLKSLSGATSAVLDIKRRLFCRFFLKWDRFFVLFYFGQNIPCTPIGQLESYFELFPTQLKNSFTVIGENEMSKFLQMPAKQNWFPLTL